MTTSMLEHRVALAHAEDPFTRSEQHKAAALLRRLRSLQKIADKGKANDHTERERAALLWALTDLGVICGELLLERRGANLRCVRPTDHPDGCDGVLGGEK